MNVVKQQYWEKLGLLFQVENDNPYLLSHASNPVATHLENDIYRIFYSGRNVDNKSSVGFVDIDIKKGTVIFSPKQPIATFGNGESFFSHGISIGNLYYSNNTHHLSFMGWCCPEEKHWFGKLGYLTFSNEEYLKIVSSKELCFFDAEDSISFSYPCILRDAGTLKMWYGSTMTWDAGNGEMLHVIKHATSHDGIKWKKHGVAIPYTIGIAQAFSRPSVLINDSGYHMWFSYRSGNAIPYRIGYAHSIDGMNWQMNNQIALDVSESGWDCDMVCYPFVFRHHEDLYMLYNGNQYGKIGFGLAKLMGDIL